MNLIACVDSKWGIGKDGRLLYSILGDMEQFKRKTMGHPVVMGRVTFESLPKPLIARTNIVLSHDKEYHPDGAIVVHSVNELAETLWRFDPCRGFSNTFVIGGEAIYRELLPFCDKAYITYVEKASSQVADRFFPVNLDIEPGWRCAKITPNEREEKTWFLEYVRV